MSARADGDDEVDEVNKTKSDFRMSPLPNKMTNHYKFGKLNFGQRDIIGALLMMHRRVANRNSFQDWIKF